MYLTVTDHIRKHLLKAVFTDPIGDKTEPLEKLKESEWSQEFEKHMREGLLMGRFRYGAFNRSNNLNYARTKSMFTRIRLYEKTGNLECLRDIANLCMLEYEHSQHPLKHWNAIDDGIHVEKENSD